MPPAGRDEPCREVRRRAENLRSPWPPARSRIRSCSRQRCCAASYSTMLRDSSTPSAVSAASIGMSHTAAAAAVSKSAGNTASSCQRSAISGGCGAARGRSAPARGRHGDRMTLELQHSEPFALVAKRRDVPRRRPVRARDQKHAGDAQRQRQQPAQRRDLRQFRVGGAAGPAIARKRPTASSEVSRSRSTAPCRRPHPPPRRDDEGAMLRRDQRRHLVAVNRVVQHHQHAFAAQPDR